MNVNEALCLHADSKAQCQTTPIRGKENKKTPFLVPVNPAAATPGDRARWRQEHHSHATPGQNGISSLKNENQQLISLPSQRSSLPVRHSVPGQHSHWIVQKSNDCHLGFCLLSSVHISGTVPAAQQTLKGLGCLQGWA